MRSVLTMLAGVLCASVAVAQAGTTTRTETGSTTTYQRITTVVGQPFMLGTESVGKVVDVVFNSNGCIEYVLVQDAEGFIVVPFGVVTVSTEQKAVIVRSSTVTVDQLREVRFTEARLPNFSDAAFTQRMTKVWGAGATRSGAGSGTTTPDRKGGTTTPDRKDPGTTTPDRKDPGTRTTPDRKDPGTRPPDRKEPGTTTPPKRGSDEPPVRTDPKNPPKKDKDKDGR
jgi:hypothetical protein